MYEGQRIPVIGNFFRITFIENPGMAFGFDPGTHLKFWISLFSLVASIGLVLYLYKIRNQRFGIRLSVALILGGAVGNLIDRMFYGVFYHYAPLFYGRVVDFLDFNFFHFSIFGREFDRWPVFNFADASVSVGVILLLIFYQQYQKSAERKDGDELAVETGGAYAEVDPPREENDNIQDVPSESNKKENLKDGKPDNGEEIPL